MDLFSGNLESAPLADRMRPRTPTSSWGKRHIVGKIRFSAAPSRRISLVRVFSGARRVRKSTLAAIVAHTTGSDFYKLNAVTSGVKDARGNRQGGGQPRTVRAGKLCCSTSATAGPNRSRTASLPAMESGVIKLIGSTTENPMAAMTSAIVSRCRLFEFYALGKEDIKGRIPRGGR